MLKLIIFIAAIASSLNAIACSFGGADVFRPTLERWEQHPSPKQLDSKAEGDYWEKVPSPIIEVTSVTRGSSNVSSSCADAGVLKLEISLPEKSTYDINEFAIYFRVIRGKLPDEIFPDIPLVGVPQNGKMSLLLAWLDGHPKYQFPLDIEVEAFLVTNSLNIGPSTKFSVTSGVGTANK